MNIAKLQYPNKETAIADLIAKGVYIETEEGLSYGQGIQAIVEIGLIVEIEGTYDDEGNVITEPIYYDGFFYDVMSEQKIEFESEIFPENCVHSFAGYPQNAEGEVGVEIKPTESNDII
jgi:hypothetical protein